MNHSLTVKMNYKWNILNNKLIAVLTLQIVIICCVEELTTDNPEDGHYRLASIDHCGLQHSDDYFHLTNKTEITEFPWLARIGYRRNGENYDQFLCLGSLITSRHVLTAAQCLDDNLKPTIIRLGEYHSYNSTDCAYYASIKAEECSDAQDFGVEKIIRHHGYINETGGVHDIGLIKLDQVVGYTDYIRPICLIPPANEKSGSELKNLTIGAWGWSKQHFSTYHRTKIKLESPVDITPREECVSRSATLQDNQVCATYVNDKVCLYDNGGPLIFSYNYQWFQEGVVLSGKRNCFVAIPPFRYTSVSAYIDWINENL
ncbi:hypothetical protein ILUMI_00600 [Ignelater luminosus]|uniref:Peptidase S1 domain-containing protein n=1 Tax=Ignelater luminosus TaxID=2038154 RepID=A0A8K0DLK7_IGNLU|nr:hypothetical protein ILUMI_00600 [Ignelater luminosus]